MSLHTALLAPNVSTTSLEARVAHHMVKMGLSSTLLTPEQAKKSPWLDASIIRSMRQGSIRLRQQDIEAVADAWGLPVNDFTRDFEDDELEALEFYQCSHYHREAVKGTLRQTTLAYRDEVPNRGFQVRLAKTLGVSTAYITHLLKGKKNGGERIVINFEQAKAFAEVMNVEGGPYFVFDGLSMPLHREARMTRPYIAKTAKPAKPEIPELAEVIAEEPEWRIIGRADERA